MPVKALAAASVTLAAVETSGTAEAGKALRSVRSRSREPACRRQGADSKRPKTADVKGNAEGPSPPKVVSIDAFRKKP